MTKLSTSATMLALSLVALPVTAPAQTSDPQLKSIAGSVNPEGLRETITRLVALGTRHTLSDTVSETRGIGAARRWARGRFEAIGALCGGCLEVVTPDHTVTGEPSLSPPSSRT